MSLLIAVVINIAVLTAVGWTANFFDARRHS